MHPMRGGVEAGRQGHGMHFSRCATTHHTRGDVREPTVLTGPDSVLPVIVKGFYWRTRRRCEHTLKRSGLLSRIDQLTQRTQQLAVNVQELERQSPYPL